MKAVSFFVVGFVLLVVFFLFALMFLNYSVDFIEQKINSLKISCSDQPIENSAEIEIAGTKYYCILQENQT